MVNKRSATETTSFQIALEHFATFSLRGWINLIFFVVVRSRICTNDHSHLNNHQHYSLHTPHHYFSCSFEEIFEKICKFCVSIRNRLLENSALILTATYSFHLSSFSQFWIMRNERNEGVRENKFMVGQVKYKSAERAMNANFKDHRSFSKHCLSVIRLWLILAASFNRSPVLRVLFARSLPARSTNDNWPTIIREASLKYIHLSYH